MYVNSCVPKLLISTRGISGYCTNPQRDDTIFKIAFNIHCATIHFMYGNTFEIS